jgi:pyrophosphatase PpaX
MKQLPIKAVFFDVDGTLLDTTTFIIDAYKYTLQQIGADVPNIDELMKRLFGIPLKKCYEILVPGHDPDILCKIHDEWQYKNLHLVTPFVTVAATIEYLQNKNIKMAAVTNRLRESAKTIMENDGITQMEAIIGFEDVVNPKPDPEGILKAVQLLGVTPEESIMVGDSEFDIVAGQKAGMRTVGIRSGLHPEAMEAAKPDYIFDEMFQITTII